MRFRATQPNYSRGELAPELRGRFDVDSYQAALKMARNVFVLKYGGVSKRPGTRFVAEIIGQDADNRLIPFSFSYEQTYALEFGQGYMAPCAFGGRVLEEELAITGITSASNAQVTAAFHGLSVGNKVWLTGISGELGALLNNRCWEVLSTPDNNNFTINADTTGFVFAGAEGGITRAVEPDPDPTPPVVPNPVEPPDPPSVGGGDSQDFGSGDNTDAP